MTQFLLDNFIFILLGVINLSVIGFIFWAARSWIYPSDKPYNNALVVSALLAIFMLFPTRKLEWLEIAPVLWPGALVGYCLIIGFAVAAGKKKPVSKKSIKHRLK